jgi:hypothetical protein
MLEFLSQVKDTFGYEVVLAPLCPCHAHNRSDARIAQMNKAMSMLVRKTRIFGAKEIASAFHMLADSATTSKRKLMKNSHVFFRVVREEDLEFIKQLGAMVQDPTLHKGRMGVHGLLFFDFSFFIATEKRWIYPQGYMYARVREYGDPELNKTYVHSTRGGRT